MVTKKTATKTPKAAKPKPKAKKVTKKSAPARSKAPRERLSLAAVMSELEKAGTAQAAKTYARHGVEGPTFGVSFATLKAMTKRIGVDHELALALWDTGNFDARNLAVKIVDPARLTPADLDRWVREGSMSRLAGGYAAMIAAETPHGPSRLEKWMASSDTRVRAGAWVLLGQLAQRDESLPDALFLERLAHIEKTIHEAPNAERFQMNGAVISIGLRNAALRKAALAAARRIGKVDIDHGDTACETPDPAEYIEKTWAYAKAKNFETPAAQERARHTPRLRC